MTSQTVTEQPIHRTCVAGRIASAAGSDPAAVAMNAEAPREGVEPGSGERGGYAFTLRRCSAEQKRRERIGAGQAVGGGVPEGAGRDGGESSPEGGRRRHGRVELRPHHRLDAFPLARSARACLGSIGSRLGQVDEAVLEGATRDPRRGTKRRF